MNYYFAPLEGVTGYRYRNLHQELFPGLDRYYSPFISTHGSLKMKTREKKDILPENNPKITLIPQLLGANADDFITYLGMLAELGYNEANFNLGCPSGTVVSRHKGAGFLAVPDELDAFFHKVFNRLDQEGNPIKISVKSRLGMEDPMEYQRIFTIYERYPICEVIIHPRTKKEMYKKGVHTDIFCEIFKKSKHPICFNGDIFRPEDLKKLQETCPGISSVMLGRGLLRNPALVREMKGGSPLSKEELFTFYHRLLQSYLEIYRDANTALNRMKELWGYSSVLFPDSKKAMKKIMKSRKLTDYEEGIRELEDGPLIL